MHNKCMGLLKKHFIIHGPIKTTGQKGDFTAIVE